MSVVCLMLLFKLILISSTSMVDFDMLVRAFVIIYVLKLIMKLSNYPSIVSVLDAFHMVTVGIS
jgi:hypothetical protein